LVKNSTKKSGTFHEKDIEFQPFQTSNESLLASLNTKESLKNLIIGLKTPSEDSAMSPETE